MDTAQEIAASLADRFELSDEDIAKRVGSSQPTIWRVRSGKTKDCAASLYRNLLQLRAQLEVGAGDTAPVEPEAPPPARALACASQSVRLTADRRQITRRAPPTEEVQPDQLPLGLDL